VAVRFLRNHASPFDPFRRGQKTVRVRNGHAYRPSEMSVRRRTAWLGVLALGGSSLFAVSRLVGAAPAEPADRTPVATNLHVLAGARDVLTWTGEAVSYRVERAHDPSGPWSTVAATGSARFVDRPPERGIYWYRVTPFGAGSAAGASTAPVSNDDVSIRRAIGQGGGVIQPITGTVVLRIPPGAIDRRTVFSIDQLESPPASHANGVVIARAFDIGPTGTSFDPPALLTIAADGSGSGALPDGTTVTARTWDPAGERWSELGTASFDAERATVTARILHLSMWTAAATMLPHGGYGEDTDYCGACHTSHGSESDPGLTAATERQVCYACHDGSGGSDVRGEFGEVVLGSTTKISTHPVPAPAAGTQLSCGDCHTAHRSPEEDTSLLRVLEADGTFRYSPPGDPIGNDFCYACHGADSTLPAPFGDHSGFQDAAHDRNDPSLPLPMSGSGIRCLACHEPHGSDSPRLIAGPADTGEQEGVCFRCHTSAAVPSAFGTTVAGAFSARENDYSTTDGNGIREYHHPIGPLEQDAGTRAVECSSCHNVHLADSVDSATGSQIVDPRDTSVPWIVTWDGTGAPATKGDVGGFCLTCHVDPTTTAPIPPGPNTPYTVGLTDDSGAATDDADGTPHDTFTAADWLTLSPHGPSATDGGIACTACHDPHGSSNAYLLREAVASPDGATTAIVTGFNGLAGDAATLQTFCQTCHASLPTDADHTGTPLCTQCHSHGTGRL
jgi:predicted CXXCH cytochrome family protein